MPQGVPTPVEQELEFRKHYLVTGNIRESARRAGIVENTGWYLAQRAHEDPEFQQARASMAKGALADAEQMVRDGLATCMARLEGEQEAPGPDPRPQYYRGIVAAYEALTRNRKLAAELSGEISRASEVTIKISGPDGSDD